MKKLLFIAMLSISFSCLAEDIFVLTKSFRSKNVLHFDVKSEGCQIASNSISAYWIMGEDDGQREGLTRDEKELFTPNVLLENGQELVFTLPAFDKIRDPIVDNPIEVRMIDCRPLAFIKIQGEEVRLMEIYANISILRQKITYIIIKGTTADGRAINHRINS